MDQRAIVPKWQARWAAKGIFKARDKSKKPKFYNLEMFPYPSGYGLHMGHVRNYSIGDTIARYKRMQGHNVLYPMGFDAFGLPAENAAIKNKIHPKEYTDKAIASLTGSLKRLGLSYDWSRTIATCTPDYYKWNQYFFLKFFEKGLAYKKKAPINWCPSCDTVLANEQVVDGKCWRCDSKVEIRDLEQWFFKITQYADELLKDLDHLHWPERIKAMQRNWIGKSTGTLIEFTIKDSEKKLPVFTTRPDTLMGVTFVTMAPEHPLVHELVHGTKYEKPVKEFTNKVVLEEKFSRAAEDKEKEGLFIGRYVTHPITGKDVPIYIANFVLMDYGTGAVMAVPAHDTRDYAFAKKYDIPIVAVIKPKDKSRESADSRELENARRRSSSEPQLPYVDDGVLFNAGQFNGLPSQQAKHEITRALEKKGCGKETTNYKLRDWLVSRQRYWGTPIPIIYCPTCGTVPVPEKDLPVKLPEKAKFTGQGNPLANTPSFVNAKCPKCKGKAKRETDTMDTFVDSSWYYLRYISPKEKKQAFHPDKIKYWMPVDQYIGGAEHAVMHLLYARFFTKVLRDLGLVKFSEPFKALFNQGIVHKDGQRMTKSKGNVVSQEEVEQKYGIDTARLFMLFVASPGKDIEWSEEGVQGSFRFLQRLEALYDKPKATKADKAVQSKAHSTLKAVTELLETLELHKAIIAIQELVEFIEHKQPDQKSLELLTLMLAPFVPHVAEEFWEKLGKKPFACTQKWPKSDTKKIDPELEYQHTLYENLKADVNDVLKLTRILKPMAIKLFVADQWKHDFYKEVKARFEKTKNPGDIIKALMQTDLRKHGEFVSKMTPKLITEPGRFPLHILGQKRELAAFQAVKDDLAKEFSCSVEIAREQDSQEPKAKNALPGKPAIVVV